MTAISDSKFFAVVLFLTFAATPIAVAEPCGRFDYGFTLACRGPLEHRIRDATIKEDPATYFERVHVRWKFVRNPVAAGRTGKALKPGTCAWEDRPVDASEPHVFFTGLGQVNPAYPPSARFFINEAIGRCNYHPDCVFVLCAKSRGSELDTLPGEVEIRFPF